MAWHFNFLVIDIILYHAKTPQTLVQRKNMEAKTTHFAENPLIIVWFSQTLLCQMFLWLYWQILLIFHTPARFESINLIGSRNFCFWFTLHNHCGALRDCNWENSLKICIMLAQVVPDDWTPIFCVLRGWSMWPQHYRDIQVAIHFECLCKEDLLWANKHFCCPTQKILVAKTSKRP